MAECGCGARLDHYESGSPYVQIIICPRHSEENVARLEAELAEATKERNSACEELTAVSREVARLRPTHFERLKAEVDRLRDHVAILEAELAAEVDSRQREVDRLRNVIVSRHGDEPIAILAELDSSRAGNERLREALELLEAERDRLRDALARLAKAARRLDEHEFGDAIAAAEELLR